MLKNGIEIAQETLNAPPTKTAMLMALFLLLGAGFLVYNLVQNLYEQNKVQRTSLKAELSYYRQRFETLIKEQKKVDGSDAKTRDFFTKQQQVIINQQLNITKQLNSLLQSAETISFDIERLRMRTETLDLKCQGRSPGR